MSNLADFHEALRRRLLEEPDLILEDRDLMKALVSADSTAFSGNVVDLRSVALKRLESRLGRLEDTHRSVVAAAYEILAGSAQIQRAAIRLLEPEDFESFLSCIEFDMCDILRVTRTKLVLESHQEPDAPALQRAGSILSIAEPGFVADYLSHGRDTVPARPVTLRVVQPGEGGLYGRAANSVKSEALLKIDLGDGRLPALWALGSNDPDQFSPNQGTDLLEFLRNVFERVLRNWLA